MHKLCFTMEWILPILTVLCTVSSIQTEQYPAGENSGSSKTAYSQDDKWYWGYADIIIPKTVNGDESAQVRQQTTTMPRTPPTDPCDPYNPEIPDFVAMGQRVSEAKCSEYIWEIKNKQVTEKRKNECVKKKGTTNSGQLYSAFAVGGRTTKNGEFPHMGAMGWEAATGGYVFKCGSSLISPKFVLTAAHCSKASTLDTSLADPVPKIIRLRSNDNIGYNALARNVNISRIIVHPQYNPPQQYYDIALIELDSEVEFNDYLRPACLWGKTDLSKFGPEATLTGWGVLESGSYVTSPNLQAAVVDIIDTQQCDELLRRSCNRNWCGVMEHQLCAGKLAGGVDACQGDSGGPLQVSTSLGDALNEQIYNVIGVTSFGIGCALPNLPGIYTRVSSFIDWIEDNVWP